MSKVRRHPAPQAVPQVETEVVPKHTRDAFQNSLARLGYGMPNPIEATSYPLTRLTKDFQLMNSLYRNNWIVKRIIDVIPEDMLKNGWKVSSQIPPKFMDKLERTQRRTQVRAQLLDGLRWGRLYGGAAAIIMIDGHETVLDKPLDLDDVFPDSYKGLIILDRWSGITPGPDVVEDIASPDYGLPSMYMVTDGTSKKSYHVHHSRVLRFTGRKLPFWEMTAEQYWGASELEHVYDDLRKRDNTSANIANLVFNANLKVLSMSELGQMLGTTNEQAQQVLYNTIQAQTWLMNNFSMFLIDKEDSFDTKAYNFGGVAEIYDMFMMDIAGAAEMPMTKLFGRSPAGMNATGESDLQNYYDTIEEKQEAYLRPVLDRLLPIIIVSCFGALPHDFDYDFIPIKRASDDEKAELGGKQSSSILEVFNSGLISPRTALLELKSLKESTGMWTNITDDDIERADPNVQPPPEQGIPGMGGQPGGAPGGVPTSPLQALLGGGGQAASGGAQTNEKGGSAGEGRSRTPVVVQPKVPQPPPVQVPGQGQVQQ